MFSSLKLNSLKCQSNGDRNGGDGDKMQEDKFYEYGDDVSDHMYEKLPSYDNKPCKCHFNNIITPSKSSKTSFSKRISKWSMECPGITNLRNPQEDSKNNQEKKLKEMPDLERLVKTKVTTVNIQREDGNLGITLRGGFHKNSDLSKPLVITYVKPDGPAAREGTIKPGDRLLAVDGVSLQGSSLNEAQTLLKQPSATTLLTIEYDVNIQESVEHASGPLLVEIERTSNQQLGLTLLQNENGIIIERVKSGSLADRCGALHVGDTILAVNSTRVDRSSVYLEDVMRILEYECPVVRLEVLPTYVSSIYSNNDMWKTKELLGITSGYHTFRESSNRESREYRKDGSANGSLKTDTRITPRGFCGTGIALTHSETLHTTLSREEEGFGIQFIDAPDGTLLINSITPGSPAERSQCLFPGDRLLAINHRSIALDNLTAKDINNSLKNESEVSVTKLNLHTEFDVLDTVVPASGIFTVNLVKRGSGGLGITMNASKSSGFIVSEMKKGSIAHRAGSLLPGDKLLAINNIPLDQCSVEYAAHILHQSTNIVTLKVQREDNNADNFSRRKITYTVDLQRYGGPLGITIAGSEEPFQPITISGLTAGGLSEQTGVIHVGDEILAINNHSLYGQPLSKAHTLLQNSSDLVTLKLSRSIIPNNLSKKNNTSVPRILNNRSPVLPSSADSAVESWDSSRLDLTSSPDHQKTLRDPRDCPKRTPQQWPPQCSTFYTPVTEESRINSTNSNSNNPDLAILDEITSENLKIKQELDLLSIKLNEQRKSKIQENENASADNIIVPSTADEVITPPETAGVDQEHENGGNSEQPELIYHHVERSDKSYDHDQEYKARDSFMTYDFESFEMAYLPETRNWSKNQYFGNESNQDSIKTDFQSSQLYEVTLYKDPIYEDFGFSVSDGLYERGVFINRIRKGGPADLSNVLKPYDRILQVNNTFTRDFDCCLTVPLIASAGDSLVLLVARNLAPNYSGNEEIRANKYHSKDTISSQEELKRILV